ncbi:MAG: RNA pseudouridine synthase [Burkholderiales bacterium]|nr:RNA pseudouridine synthase [Burkholderiales bacterium]MDE2626757.1 RNA pseudouridine synthase [Burkholderiales bacterium]
MPPLTGLALAHQDADCIVAVKPAGLLAVPGRGEHGRDCLAARVQAAFADALVVHRLDMATSGLMLFARGAPAQRRLSQAFAQREVHKRYTAVVHGRLDAAQGEIDLPLIADWPNRPRQKVDAQCGKPSLTRYRVIAFDEQRNTSRLELEPVTGRAHQLRVHLLAIGHPIVGDTLYAPPEVRAGADRLLLHATSLRFMHPASGTPVQVDSAAPF